MVPLTALWLPILLSAVAVFIASSLIHMVLKYHASDYSRLPAEDAAAAALRGVAPGLYTIPHAGGTQAMSDPVFVEKMKTGPVAFITVRASGPVNLGKQLALWFAFSVVVSIFAGYIAGRALDFGADYASVFRYAGTTAFVGYAVSEWMEWIWYGRPTRIMLKNTMDGLIYALLTAGVFGWLWPSMGG